MPPGVDLDACLKAIANPVRREILALLKKPGENFAPNTHVPNEDGVCVASIITRMKLAQSTVSQHLAILQRARLLSSKSIGQWTYFRRDEKTIRRFMQLLKQEL